MNRNITYLQLALSMAIVGSAVVVGKIITTTLPIYLSACVSLFIASAVLVPVLLVKEGIPKLSKRDFILLFLQTLIGTFLYRIFLLNGLKFTNALESGIITSTGPAVMAVLSIIFLKEKFAINKLLGILLTVCGILAMHIFVGADNKEVVEQSNSILGGVLVFLSVVAASLFSVLAKPISPKITPIVISSFVSVTGFILFLPMALLDLQNLNENSFDLKNILSVIYYGVVVTVIAFLLWFEGLKKIEISTAGIFMGIIPVSSTILSIVFLGEELSIAHLIGGLLVILGILIIVKKN